MSTLDTNTENFCISLVVEYMHQQTPFTSVDIANQAKDAGYFARNRHVAEWLRTNAIELSHQFSFMYNQTLIRVDSKTAGMTFAYLYHHFQDDADNYLDRDQNPKNPGYASVPANVPVQTFNSTPTVKKVPPTFTQPTKKMSRGNRVIRQYRLNGTLIETFSTIASASARTNVDASNIGKAIRGERETAGGYIWGRG